MRHGAVRSVQVPPFWHGLIAQDVYACVMVVVVVVDVELDVVGVTQDRPIGPLPAGIVPINPEQSK